MVVLGYEIVGPSAAALWVSRARCKPELDLGLLVGEVEWVSG